MPFRFQRLAIPDVALIEPQLFRDSRGAFMEVYKRSDFEAHGISATFVQDAHSRSARGVLRGLHFQRLPSAQAKLVYVAHGAVFDVAVDIRKGSPSYGKWVSAELSSENRHMLFIPEGFAHGFCVLTDQAHVVYKLSAEYAPGSEGGILWNDPDIGIPWPGRDHLIAPKDAAFPPLRRCEHGFVYEGSQT